MRRAKIQCHQMTMVLELNMHSDMAYMNTDLHTTCLQNEILVASPENKLPSKKIIIDFVFNLLTKDVKCAIY